jgi:hypothetical protein
MLALLLPIFCAPSVFGQAPQVLAPYPFPLYVTQVSTPGSTGHAVGSRSVVNRLIVNKTDDWYQYEESIISIGYKFSNVYEKILLSVTVTADGNKTLMPINLYSYQCGWKYSNNPYNPTAREQQEPQTAYVCAIRIPINYLIRGNVDKTEQIDVTQLASIGSFDLSVISGDGKYQNHSSVVGLTLKGYYKIGNNILSLGTGLNNPSQIVASAPSGGDLSYTYQWQSSSDNVNWNNITGATGANIPSSTAIPNLVTYYRRIVNCVNFNFISSISNVVSVNQISNNIISSVVSNGLISFTGTQPTLGGGSYSYQWQYKTQGNGWLDINGANSLNYTTSVPSFTTLYRRIVRSPGAIDLPSNEASFIVSVSNNIISSVTGNYSLNPYPGHYVDFGISLNSQPSGGDGATYTYRWQASHFVGNPENWVDVAGAQGPNLVLPTMPKVPTSYRRVVYSIGGTPSYSNVANFGDICCNEWVVCNQQMRPITISTNFDTQVLSTNQVIITWYSSLDQINFTQVSQMPAGQSGALRFTPPTPAVGTTIFYRAKLQCGNDELITNIVARGNQTIPNIGYINKGYCSPACGNALDKLYVGLMSVDPEDFLDEDIKHDKYLSAKAATVSIENFSSNENFYFEANSTQPCGTSSNREGDEIQVITDEASFLETAFNVYPNPSNGTLFFTSNSKDVIENVRVMSLLGEKIYESSYSISGESSIKLNVTNGIYLVLATMNGKVFKKQIVIQNDGF